MSGFWFSTQSNNSIYPEYETSDNKHAWEEGIIIIIIIWSILPDKSAGEWCNSLYLMYSTHNG